MFSPGHFAARHYKANHFPGGGGGGLIVETIAKYVGFIKDMGRMMNR